MNCGLYVPSHEERLKLGVRHKPVHPNHERHDDLMKLEGAGPDWIGAKIKLPDSTPKDRQYRSGLYPFVGASRSWSDRTSNTAHLLSLKAPGALMCTYAFHGRRAGSYVQWKRGAWGIDFMLSDLHQKASAAEEEAGDRLTYWAVRNFYRLHLNYVIYWGWMLESPETGWFDYRPYAGDYTQGDQNPVTALHFDHAHFQVDVPYVAGNN